MEASFSRKSFISGSQFSRKDYILTNVTEFLASKNCFLTIFQTLVKMEQNGSRKWFPLTIKIWPPVISVTVSTFNKNSEQKETFPLARKSVSTSRNEGFR